jgi:DNA helicase-2/ATP-dependent DNA helicase PcrA
LVDVLDGLNPQQRLAAEAVRGPVCILAGAGSGKTTTITRRIAHQVASAAFRPADILAVTFTDKAAGALKSRLAALGVSGVTARTFHSAALAQLHRYRPDAAARILPTKALALRPIAARLPPPFRFRSLGDLATEIEWAKSQRLRPDSYQASLGTHQPPLPAELMVDVYREYERRKQERGEIDFEDLLERTIELFESDERALADLRARYRAFTVDEYQDVNLLQQTLLDLWLGTRDDLCVVGDDYQSIYAFTGASPHWLLGVEARFPGALAVRLEDNYRSSPQVLELANRLVPRLGGAEKRLRSTRGAGPEPLARRFASPGAEVTWIATEIERLARLGVPLDGVAVLCRTNARLADFEQAFHDAAMPFQGSSLLAREAARQLLRALAREPSAGARVRVSELAREAGLVASSARLGERELTRQADLARLVRLAAELGGGELSCAEFVTALRRRFDTGGVGAEGVHLLTYHAAKGLEFDAVFLPRLEEKEIPSRLARSPADVAEERRLLYVGITRARNTLTLTWSRTPSPFLAELGVVAAVGGRHEAAAGADSQLAERLRHWRRELSQAQGVPAYAIFPDRSLEEIVERRPASLAELAAIHGLGSSRLARFGEQLLTVLGGAPLASPASGSPAVALPKPGGRVHHEPDGPGLYGALAAWRRDRSKRERVAPFLVFHNRVLAAIAEARPRSREELAGIAGVGPAKLERYGDDVLEVVAAA